MIDRFGGPDELHLAEVSAPVVGPTDVMIAVRSAGLGSWDKDERAGGFAEEYAAPPSFPYVLGWDGAGDVVEVGSEVERFSPGDVVYAASTAAPRGGFYAELAVVDQEHVALVPDGIPVEQAGAMAWDSLTAMSGLETLALHPDETLLVFGASGGIGHFAVQLARRWGVRVIAVASGGDGVALCRRLGATLTIDGRRENITDAVTEFAPEGVDAVLLTAGGPAGDEVLSLLTPDGRAASPHGVDPVPGGGATVPVRFYSGDRSRAGFDRLAKLIANGDYETALADRFPFSEAVNAHHALAGHYAGKMALIPGIPGADAPS
ncbi:zinc-binding alcohol dehydrogenase family protein [Microbacterium sp. NPDC057961]|uniref:quinone oxidoreductase family protein n=1 Tax=Microbacterium sp. NPDC057961 TaxID=3346289 RepID=UPI0036DA0798